MSRLITALGALALTTTAAQAGGIDRSGQGLLTLFEKNRVVELTFGTVSPDVTGVDVLGNQIADVANNYTSAGLAFKDDLTDKLSYAFIIDTPFSADILYGGNPLSTMLGGTKADADSTALTGLLRYKFTERASVYGGLRMQQANAGIALGGLAYAGLNGYAVSLASDTALGYVLGASFEIPDIALRVAVTYNSAIKHDFLATETLAAATLSVANTEVETPQSVNIDFQSGVAEDTIVFGQIRWVDWSQMRLSPNFFSAATGGSSLIDLDDTTTYTLGVGRRFTETWSGAFSLTYEAGTDPLVSPLAPTDGRFGATLAGVYTVENLKIAVGVNYTELGDAMPQTAGVARANFTGNTAIGLGVKVGYTF